MKKIFLLITLLLQITFFLGQERDEVGHRVTSWMIARHGCFAGIEWKVRKSYYSENSNNFINEIEITNKYSTKITFSFDVSADANAKTTQSRKILNPQETTRFTKVQNVDFVYLYIADVCFNSDNRCSGTCYALCDNGTPNIPTDCGGQQSYDSNHSVNQTNNQNQQNDLTEYNNKADIERQIAEKNAEIQRQKLENQHRAEEERQRKLQQQQQYNNSVNQANTSLGNKDYQGAIQNYGEAGKNTSTKGEKNLAVAGVATSGALGILEGIQKQKEWNAERKRLKAERAQNAINENEKRVESEINTMTDPKTYETYCDFVISNLEALGFQFTGISEILAFKNDSKYIKFDFNNGELEAVVRQAYYNGTMQNHISLITSNTMFHTLLLSSDLVAFLGSYNYWENKTFDDWKRNIGNKIEYELNFGSLFRLEKSQPFIETYMNPYRTSNYAGISEIIKEKEQKKAEFIPVKSKKTPTNDITVQYVIDKYITAIGGLGKLKTVQNIVTVRESKDSKQKATFAYGKFISELTYKGNIYKTVFNGVTGYRESENKKSNLDDASISIYKKGQPFPIFQLQQEPNLELGEMVVFKKKECYTIIEKGNVSTLNFVKKHFFDTSSGLWIGTENLFTGTNYSSTNYDYYDDYREVGGILFPFLLQRGSEKDISTTRTIEIKVNQPLTDKDFE